MVPASLSTPAPQPLLVRVRILSVVPVPRWLVRIPAAGCASEVEGLDLGKISEGLLGLARRHGFSSLVLEVPGAGVCGAAAVLEVASPGDAPCFTGQEVFRIWRNCLHLPPERVPWPGMGGDRVRVEARHAAARGRLGKPRRCRKR